MTPTYRDISFYNLYVYREVAVKTRDRLVRMREDKDAFLGDLLKQRKAAYDKKLSDFNARVERERAIRMAERKQKRRRSSLCRFSWFAITWFCKRFDDFRQGIFLKFRWRPAKLNINTSPAEFRKS